MQEILKQFASPKLSRELLLEVKKVCNTFIEKNGRKPILMEVCGSHTMALAKTGVKKALLDHVQLISGPGCPVCVTDQETIDQMIALSENDNLTICTFGDMIRVPGNSMSLLDSKSAGKDIRIVYSPLDAVKIAASEPTREVVFLGIGFETTIPILAAAIKEAEEKSITNFSVWMTTKLVEPVLRVLLNDNDVKLDGFLLPGHVSLIIGEDGFQYLPNEFNKSGVITGFEPVQLLGGIYKIVQALNDHMAAVINDYTFAVTKTGNSHAINLMNQYFTLTDEGWRGIGVIPNSGYDMKEEFSAFNAKSKFGIPTVTMRKTKCRCGEVIKGMIEPTDCPLFGKACTPIKPIGPCMVSTEGSCAAHYQYMRED